MSYLERERRRMVAARDAIFCDPGQGRFAGHDREFVLSEAAQNLWSGIRDDAIDYFARHRISWWGGSQKDPTGHLLSSVACVNHLYPLRQRSDLAAALLRDLDPQIVAAEPIDDGLITFEFIGSQQYMKERGFSRGSHCTSVDAAMIGRTGDGDRRLFLIEWKYTECYAAEDKYIAARASVYDHLIDDEDSPFSLIEPRSLYFDPFDQLMRQTLLGHLCAKHQELGCTSYRHVHVAPDENREFHETVTSPALPGASVYEAWRSVLNRPDWFITRSPELLMRPLESRPDWLSHSNYLAARYWAGL